MNISFIPILFLKCYSQRSQKLHNNFYALYLFLPPLVPNVGYLGFFFPPYLSILQDYEFEGKNCVLFIFANSIEPGPICSVNECGMDVTFGVYVNKHKHFVYLYAILLTSSLNIEDYQ